MQVRVHLGFQDWQGAELGQLRCVCIEVEATGDQRVESGIQSFPRRCGQVAEGNGAEFGADENTHPFSVSPSINRPSAAM